MGEDRRGRSTDDDRGYPVRPGRHHVRAAAPHPVCPRYRVRRSCPPDRASSSRPAKAFARSWVNHRDCPQERHLAPDLYTDAARTSTEPGSRESEAPRTADKSPLPTASRCEAARRLHVDAERRVGLRTLALVVASATADANRMTHVRACVVILAPTSRAARPARCVTSPVPVAMEAKVYRRAIRTKYGDPDDNGAPDTPLKIHLHLRGEPSLLPALHGEKTLDE
jgi:hypothetical protein